MKRGKTKFRAKKAGAKQTIGKARIPTQRIKKRF